MATTDQLQPQVVNQFINLVERLYQPASPEQVKQISTQILKIQELNIGWQLAFALLTHHDEKIRFYGALTLQRKLNTQCDTISEEVYGDLLTKLISSFLQLISQGEGALVIKKFCSTLVAYAFRIPDGWSNFMRTLLCSLHRGNAVPTDTLSRHPPSEKIVPQLRPKQLSALLQFSHSLADEIGKLDLKSILVRMHHVRVEADASDNALVMQAALSAVDVILRRDALSCFNIWVLYAQRAWSEHSDAMQHLRGIIRPAMECFLNKDTMDGAVELFADIMTCFSYFLNPEHCANLAQFLRSPLVGSRLEDIAHGDQNPEDRKLVGLYVAFADSRVEHLVESPDEETSKFLLDILQSFLLSGGYPGQDDLISGPVLEFWSTYVEHVNDTLMGGSAVDVTWYNPALHRIAQVLEACWSKSRFPNQDDLDKWDSDSRAAFSDFRADVKDLVQSSYPLLGSSLASRFADLALQSLGARDWWSVEASLFFLNATADQMTEAQPEDCILLRVFDSTLFREIVEAPGRVSKTALSLVGSYSPLFARYPESLPAVLNYLFSTLSTHALATEASRTIYTLCSSCRRSLTAYLDSFIQQYRQFLGWPAADRFTKEKVIGAIAAIVQALPSENEKAAPLQHLLDFVELDVRKAKGCFDSGDIEQCQDAGMTALTCLASMGRAMQVPDDVPLELDSDSPEPTFWTEPEGQAVQNRILEFMDGMMNMLYNDGEIIEAVCQVLKTGYSEFRPGPFVFPPHATVKLFNMVRLLPEPTPRLEAIINAACTLLTTRSSESSVRIVDEAAAILVKSLSLIIELPNANADPELAQSLVDLIGRYIPRYVDVFVAIEPLYALERVFSFTLQCLGGGDILPKRSATVFWSSWLQLSNQPPHLQTRIDHITNHFGPESAATLVRQIAGDCARSELDFLAEPLKSLVCRHPKAKAWLQAPLMLEHFPNERVTQYDKGNFLEKILRLRGGRFTNSVVKEFWIACRGTGLAYTS